MGGGHHDFGPKMKIPDYSIYKVADAPELVQVQEVLAAKGLKDPWLRNEVWRYNRKEWWTHRQRLVTFVTRGMKVGFGLFLVTTAIETAMAAVQPQHPPHH